LKNSYGIDFIVGYTENGVPYGTMIDENNEMDEPITKDSSLDSNDELPF
jgi:orotate phosphoribosyltransferase-like protein